eukprot:1709403-Amphidinium_carterae.1
MAQMMPACSDCQSHSVRPGCSVESRWKVEYSKTCGCQILPGGSARMRWRVVLLKPTRLHIHGGMNVRHHVFVQDVLV